MSDSSAANEFGKQRTSESVIAAWVERDLSAELGTLSPAFGVDDNIRRLEAILAAGKNPVVTGGAGVGKTALILELIRRAAQAGVNHPLHGRRVLQMSIRRRAAGLGKTRTIGEDFEELLQALMDEGGMIVPYIRDIDLAWSFDLESQLEALALRLNGPILAEGERMSVQAMFEYQASLEQSFERLHLSEPSLDKTRELIQDWAFHLATGTGGDVIPFEPEAIDASIELSHRFLSGMMLPRKALEPLAQMHKLFGKERVVDEQDVISRFCENHRLPRFLIDPKIELDLDELSSRFREQVLGQPEAIAAVVDTVALVKAGLSDPRRPFGIFLFTGPTGVGKTHLARALAETLFGAPDRMVRINMADYPDDNGAGILFGDADMPASQRKGVLCQRLAGQPFAVLLLDEFEKASSTVHDRFLQLFDEGEFINGAGDTVSCRSLIIIATSNTGAEVYRGGLLGFAGGWNQATIDREIERHLQDSFRFEFLNRFDRLVAFSPLDRETIREIALRELRALEQRSGLRRRGLKIELDDGVIDWLSVRGYHPDYGARFLHRTIEREVSTPVAGLLVRQVETEGRQVALSVRAGRVHARLTPRIAPLAARQAQVAVSEASGAALSKAMDRAELARQGRAIVEAGDSMLPEFELRRAEYESLLVTIGQPDFWSRERDDELLERFRVLDVSLQVEGRHLEAIESLREELDRCERESTRNLEALARAFEAGTDALDAWRHRRASEGEGSVWMIISRLDPLREGTDVSHWIRELVRMECAWCKAQGLEVTPVAIGPAEGDPLRVALLVEGPGSQSYLAMEEGEHRMHREGAGDLRAKVEVCVRNARPTSDGGVSQAASARDRERGAKSAAHDLRAIRSRGTVINDLKASHTISLALEKRGRTLTFLGAEPELMLCLMDDLARAWDHDGHAAPELARIYGASGRGASDPRTEASVARLKDVLKGRLERFFDAWCSRSSN